MSPKILLAQYLWQIIHSYRHCWSSIDTGYWYRQRPYWVLGSLLGIIL